MIRNNTGIRPSDLQSPGSGSRTPMGTLKDFSPPVSAHTGTTPNSHSHDKIVQQPFFFNHFSQQPGCNTVSVTVRPKDAFTLCPDLDGCDPERTLVLATPRTLSVLDAAKRGFMTADTSELAVLTEIQMSLSYKSRTKPSCAPLKEYLSARLRSLPHPPERVLLGCSHYVYAAKEIRAVTGGEGYSDGNDALTDRVANALPHDLRTANGGGDVRFLFTGADESAKYAWLLAELERHYVPLALHKAFYLPK